MIRNHAYQKLFPFVVTRSSSLLPLPSTRICDQHVVKLHILELSPFPYSDRHVVKLHILELSPFPYSDRYVVKLQLSEPSPIVWYDIKLHLPGLGPDAQYGAKLQPRTSRSPRQYR
jgi:hypothetical protein